jgi:type II secretory pathway pseudopilin PulG
LITIKFFDIDGNEARQEDWAEALVLGVINNTIEQYKQRALANVSKLTCTTHGGRTDLVFNVTENPEQMSIEIHATACCDEFAQIAVQKAQKSWSTE